MLELLFQPHGGFLRVCLQELRQLQHLNGWLRQRSLRLEQHSHPLPSMGRQKVQRLGVERAVGQQLEHLPLVLLQQVQAVREDPFPKQERVLLQHQELEEG